MDLLHHLDGDVIGDRLGLPQPEVPVAEVADQLGVSRQTVYNWFEGTHFPHPDLTDAIEALLKSYIK